MDNTKTKTNNNSIILVLGRTGSGKDTLVNAISEHHNLKVLKSYTTRPRRKNEQDTHIFINDQQYQELKDDIVAYTEINGYKYFSTRSQLEECDIYIVDPNGQKYLTETCPDINFISVYIHADPQIRKARALNTRKDNPDVFKSRNLDEDARFTKYEKYVGYNYLIENEDLEKAVSEFNAILSKHLKGGDV